MYRNKNASNGDIVWRERKLLGYQEFSGWAGLLQTLDSRAFPLGVHDMLEDSRYIVNRSGSGRAAEV